jgi:pimeloyl-ACP methyl ester carboxylesterase
MLQRTTTSFGQVAWRVFQPDGGKTPLVCLHGAGGRKEMWGLVARRLGKLDPDQPVVLVDLPGHGQSPPPGRASIDEYAAALAELVEAAGWGQVAVAGHSMGGAVAQTFALRRPDLLAHLLLVATGAFIPVAPILFDLLPDQHEMVTTLFKEMGFGPNAPAILVDQAMTPFAQTDPEVIAGDLKACEGFNSTDHLGGIAAPTLVVLGELDRMINPKVTAALIDLIPGARLIRLADTGHMIPVEADRELARHFAEFLSE